MPSSSRITSLALLIYGPLALAGVVWARIGTDRWPWSLPEPWLGAPAWARLMLSLGSGLALALVVVAVTPRLVERTRWARALEAQLKEILAPLSKAQITVLAVVSGLAEELFFRGAMQPVLGLVAAAVIFGAAHLGPREVFPAWAIWAFLLGLVLGSIFALTGMLWGPILAHVWINQRNMIFLKQD